MDSEKKIYNKIPLEMKGECRKIRKIYDRSIKIDTIQTNGEPEKFFICELVFLMKIIRNEMKKFRACLE